MWHYYLAAALVALWWFVLRPRSGGKGSPPLVTESKMIPIPIFGVIAEFLKSPNDMMKRCLQDYGSVFTIPVSHFILRLHLSYNMQNGSNSHPVLVIASFSINA